MNIARQSRLKRGWRWKARIVQIYFALKDPATPFYSRWLLVGACIYLVSPIDLIPDFIPVAGWLDDLVIVPLLVSFSIRSLPWRVQERSMVRAEKMSRKINIIGWMAFALTLVSILVLVYRMTK